MTVKKTSRTNRARFRQVPALRAFLKRFGTGQEAMKRRVAFAQRLDTSVNYLSQLVLGFRQASMDMAVKIERASYGHVRVEDLLPSEHWAYLANRIPGPPPSSQVKRRPGRPRKVNTATAAI